MGVHRVIIVFTGVGETLKVSLLLLLCRVTLFISICTRRASREGGGVGESLVQTGLDWFTVFLPFPNMGLHQNETLFLTPTAT